MTTLAVPRARHRCGLTVAVSLAALVLATVPFLRSIGLAGLLIPPINIAVSATLLHLPRRPRR